MEHSSLVDFLNGVLSPEAFEREISNEVNACEHGFKTEGMGYIMVPAGPTQVITRGHARKLLEAMLSDQLTFLAANYTADCLMMSDNFDFADEAVAEAIAFVADDSRPPTHDETKAAIAALSQAGICPRRLVMCDVDHFKRFNDEFGHDAGDAVLQVVAAEMRSRFHDGDVACRFGGEEFTIIAPGTTAEALSVRVEAVRRAIAELAVRRGSRSLGSTSMSFGIATWTNAMAGDGSTLLQAADIALYQSKREGRNRATISLVAA